MHSKFHFTFEPDWRFVPGAFWVHRPLEGMNGTFAPPAPPVVPHKGYPILHVEFEEYELLFSSAAQIEHYIDVLSQRALPTTRQLSKVSGLETGPNQHWLSRLPAKLKAPKNRRLLVEVLDAAKHFAADNAPTSSWREVAQSHGRRFLPRREVDSE